jgi:hypothetical protein
MVRDAKGIYESGPNLASRDHCVNCKLTAVNFGQVGMR